MRQSQIVQNITLGLYSDTYTGVAVLFSLAGLLLCLCALRSLLRHYYSGWSSLMWPHCAQIGLGLALALLLLLDGGMANPNKGDYWNAEPPRFDMDWYEASRLFQLSAAGWSSAIVFLVYVAAASITAWTSVSARKWPS